MAEWRICEFKRENLPAFPIEMQSSIITLWPEGNNVSRLVAVGGGEKGEKMVASAGIYRRQGASSVYNVIPIN